MLYLHVLEKYRICAHLVDVRDVAGAAVPTLAPFSLALSFTSPPFPHSYQLSKHGGVFSMLS